MRIACRPALALLLPALLFGQSPSGMQEILDRLQRLEDQNKELMTEIRALRQELESRNAPAATPPAQPPPPETAAAPAQAPPLQERVAVNEQRIQDLSQSKVEAEHKLPVRLTGMLLFNAFANGRNSGGLQYPTIAAPAAGPVAEGATVRQSILGLSFDGPTLVGGGKASGSLLLDLWGGSGSSLNQLVRLRVATLDLTWGNTTFTVGQDKPIIAPRDPTSLAQVAFSPLTAAGNLWLWQPQARLEHHFLFGRQTGLRAQFGLYQTNEGGNSAPAGYISGSARPGYEGRFAFWHDFGDGRRIEIAPGFHASQSHVEGVTVPSRVFSLDWLMQPARAVDFTGAFFTGENVGVLGGLRQGISLNDYDRIRATAAIGGWGQITVRPTSRLSFNVYAGEEDDRNSDLAPGAIGRNFTYAGNVIYRLGSNVLASFEAAQTRTMYIGTGLRLNPHYDLALAYLY